MRITLHEGDFGTFLLVREDGRELLAQADWDFPGLASTFGWSPCSCGETDGTVDCPHRTADDMIVEARDLPSMPLPASKPGSPAASSRKSNGVSTGVVEAALQAAGKTFSEKPSLALADALGPTRGPLDGKHRLQGAYATETRLIRPDPRQPRRRLDTAAQKELNDSVNRLGILQPITVRFLDAENVYQITTGERRYHAACEARFPEIPCWVQSPRDEEVLLHQIVENWQRLDMHPYDLADALARLRDANGYNQNDLARETGKSKGEISKLLALLDLDPRVQKVARQDESGRITRSHLYAVRPLPADEQLALIRRTQQEALTTADMEAIVAKRIDAPEGRKRRGAPVSQHRFATSRATVTITFRKKDVSREDLLAAVDEVRAQILPPAPVASPSPVS